MEEHYNRFDFSKDSDRVEFYNEKLKKCIISHNFLGVVHSVGNGADAHRRSYWFYWYAMEHFEESEAYRDIIPFLREDGAVTSGEIPPKEPEFVPIYLADTL